MSADRRTYSTGSYQKLENGKYRLFVSGGTGLGRKRVRRTKTVQARSDREAERLLKAFQAEIDALTNKEKMTVNAMLDLFEEDRLETTSIRTQEWYRETLRRVRAALGHMDLQELRPKDVHAFYRRIADPKSAPLDGLSGGLSPTYVLHHHRALKAAMAWAYKNDLTDRNIMDKVTSPKSEPVREKRALTDEEIQRFCVGAENLGLRWKAILLLALGTGMRRQELCALSWADVDFEAGTLTIRRAVQRQNGLNRIGPTKNTSSIRTISVAPELLALLKAWKQVQAEQRLRSFCPWEGDWVFTTSLGNTIPIDKFTHTAAALFQRMEIPNATFHTLRHTCATRMLEAGVPANDVAAYLGHASTQMTLDVYGHPGERFGEKCVAAVQSYLNWHANGTRAL